MERSLSPGTIEELPQRAWNLRAVWHRSARVVAVWAMDLTPLGAVMVLLGAVVGLRKWAENDLFWHLANGRMLADGGSIARDQFSWSAAGRPYLAYSALFDHALYDAWKIGGATALSVLSAAAFCLVLLPTALMIGRVHLRPPVELGMLALIFLALLPYNGARPSLVAAALSAWLALLLVHPFRAPKAIAAGAILALWANMHGSFQIGFGLVGCAIVAWIIDHHRTSAFWAAVAALIGVGGSLASPQGVALWTGPLRTIGNPLLSSFNQDWQSLRPFQGNLAAAGLLILLALLVGLWRATDPRALAALGLVLPTIQLARFTPFSAPLLAVSTADRLRGRWPFLGTSAPRPRSVLIASWALLLVGLPTMLLWPGTARSIENAMMVQPLPEAAAQQLLACGRPAPVWNDYFWGGYLTWLGHGQWTVGIDGRMETLYTNEMLQDYLAVQNGAPGWQEIIEHSPARYALLHPAVAERLDALPDWTSVYVDDSAAIVARAGSPWHCSAMKHAESSSTKQSRFTVS